MLRCTVNTWRSAGARYQVAHNAIDMWPRRGQNHSAESTQYYPTTENLPQIPQMKADYPRW